MTRGCYLGLGHTPLSVAALVDYALYERINRLCESFVALTDKLGQVYADVPAERAEAEIDTAVRHGRRRSSR